MDDEQRWSTDFLKPVGRIRTRINNKKDIYKKFAKTCKIKIVFLFLDVTRQKYHPNVFTEER